MTCPVEKEKPALDVSMDERQVRIFDILGNNECLDNHHPACSNNGQEGDDVHYADGIEYDEAWASQRFVEELHVARCGLRKVG